MHLTFSPSHPEVAPSCSFVSPIYHPNVANNGALVLPQLVHWKPTDPASVASLLGALRDALRNPLRRLDVPAHVIPQVWPVQCAPWALPGLWRSSRCHGPKRGAACCWSYNV